MQYSLDSSTTSSPETTDTRLRCVGAFGGEGGGGGGGKDVRMQNDLKPAFRQSLLPLLTPLTGYIYAH
jgi:hypothetical protein